ncbi:DNA repair rhp54 [Fusarium longipes]|uniref:DNA repair rhp54 n=1 Tax=Fusarium longipes TaxID=694270 RepID=A0A395RUG9_9HYPO|nr:DNA repair rhp54 [Fusarium longipes]
MDGSGGGDPYSWDIEAVVQRLCVPSCPWSRDPDSLAARIREEEIDGKTLLTYEHICSRQELMGCLDVRVARHKAALLEAIVTFRSQSKGYWLWEQDFKRKKSRHWDEQAEERTNGSTERAHSFNSPSGGHQQQDERFAATSTLNAAIQNADERLAQVHASVNRILEPQKDSQNNTVGDSHPSPAHERPAQGTEGDERSPKRRRMAPILLSERPHNIAPAFLPTEADVLAYTVADAGLVSEQASPWENAPSYAYLGDGTVSREAIISPDDALTSLIRENKDSFYATSSYRIPPARRLVVNKVLKRLFMGRYRLPGHSSSSQSLLSDPTDRIYELADLGGGDEFDDATWKEIQEEQLENERLEALHHDDQPDLYVTPERVAEILNETIETVEANWQEKKLPRYERKSHSIWQKSRRHGTKKLQIRQAHEMATRLIDRIQKLCYEIQKQDWTSESFYRDASKSLEQSLEDKLYQMWLIKMLESTKPPPKPQGVFRPKPTTVQQPTGLLQDEVLTSSDEDDFIAPDDHADLSKESPGGDQGPSDHTMKEETMDVETTFVDLTMDDSDDHEGLDSIHPIDLTSPAKKTNTPRVEEAQRDALQTVAIVPESFVPGNNIPGSTVSDAHDPVGPATQPNELALETTQHPHNSGDFELPSMENFGDLQKFASASLSKLAKNNDRWRLLIGEIWQMEHERRKAAVDLILSDEPNVVWSQHIVPYLDASVRNDRELNQNAYEMALFDTTRLCYCFFLGRHKAEEQMLKTKPAKTKKRLEQQQSPDSTFESFCMFVKLLQPHFPQDSQIYKQEANTVDDRLQEEEDDLDNLDDLDDIDAEDDRGRRRAPEKEIIRDKAAVDLREREKQRLEEQELRRIKLRATIASQPSVMGDENGIIINESKEDDQGLIYVNDHIARSIKQHQIDGVRFIWNQIVRDASVRQGCLLAHTMGLGKTMQVITVLVALAEASESPDPSIVAQIPTDLQHSRTLVLCPAALVDNWMDELLKWAPANVLGELRKVTASTPAAERSSIVTAWASGKGVLLVGYGMFQKLLGISQEMLDLLTNTPNVVVCDEAHHMKNRQSKTHLACSRFQTKSRIALTGSPLSNNVLEYFAMINWVAPNFLGPYSEFREIYSAPVERGLYHDSTASEKRKAQKILKALEQMVAPKVNRCTIAVLKGELPPKQEFIIFVPPTEPQRKLYQLYIDGISREGGDTQAATFAAINHLGLICSHPKCFQAKVDLIQKGNSSRVDDEKETDKTFPKSMIPQFKRTLESFRDLISPAFSWKTELLTHILNEAREVNDKVLVFSQSLHTLDYLEHMCKTQRRTVSRLDGSTLVSMRQQQVKDFNQGSKEVFLISTTAGGVGLNIQGANRVVIFDVRYNPAHEQQAVGRAYRIGQQKKVFVYRLMVAGTFEDNLNNKQVFKMQLASRVVDKKNPISWSKRKGDVVAEIKHRAAANLDPYIGKDHILDKLIKIRENGEAIRSIVSTDTFEEEDLNATLTEEEKKEVAKMIEMSQLRVSNPEEYARIRVDMDLMEQARLHREQEQLSRPAPSHPVHQSFNGATDMPSDPQFPPVSSTATPYQWDLPHTSRPPVLVAQGLAPRPMAGANTFFGENRHPETATEQHSASIAPFRDLLQSLPPRNLPAGSPKITQLTSTPLSISPNPESRSTQHGGIHSRASPIFKQGGVFNVVEIPARAEFQTLLREKIYDLQDRGVPPARGHPFEDARALTTRIDRIRKEGQYGLLPDTRHWRVLNEFISHDKFVIAIISGYISPEYVAQATAEELKERFKTISGFDETQILSLAREKANDPDPIV